MPFCGGKKIESVQISSVYESVKHIKKLSAESKTSVWHHLLYANKCILKYPCYIKYTSVCYVSKLPQEALPKNKHLWISPLPNYLNLSH